MKVPRSIPEWIGKTPDTPIPPRVKLRIWDRDKGLCQICGNRPFPIAEYDHKDRIKDGGEHRESNIRLVCQPCHKRKSASERKVGKKVDRTRKKHMGISKPKGRPLPGTKASGWKQKIDGTWERRT